jgi:hypothetical protein
VNKHGCYYRKKLPLLPEKVAFTPKSLPEKVAFTPRVYIVKKVLKKVIKKGITLVGNFSA